jgi:hypothetical protein
VPLQLAAEAFVVVHLSPQALQLLVVVSAVQVPLHTVSGASHVHEPLTQVGAGCAHAPQAAPPVPHRVFDWEPYGSHTPALQQPFGQDAALHTHCPVLVLHARPVPHATQVAPPEPQEVLDSLVSGSHVEPLQQPAHDPPPHVHAPFEQESPLPHEPHAAPAVPHSLVDCEAYRTQVLPLQQPPGQDAALQTHWPLVLSHAWPDAHAAQVAPEAPQEAFDSEVYASQVPLVPPLQQPLGQVLASHSQTPTVVSQRPLEQDPQEAPPLPHCEDVCEA